MWARMGGVAIGIWLMAAPAVLAYGDPAATNDRIFGPIAAGVAGVAMWQVTRAVRWANLVVGAWLALAPLILGYPLVPFVNSLVAGLGLMALSTIRGKVDDRFGGGWMRLVRRPSARGS